MSQSPAAAVIDYLPAGQKVRWEAPAQTVWRGAPILTGVFFVGVLIQMSRHIMWRDELRTWMICREATGLISLWELMRYDAVPFVWNWIVFVLTRVTDNPAAMQVTHALIASAVVYVVARWAPFSRTTKTLFAFGYYPFFEYAVLARNYAPLNLLIMIACVLISRPRVPMIWLAVVAFFMAQVSLWGMGFAMLFYFIGVVKVFMTERDIGIRWDKAAIGEGIVLLGMVICVIQLFPGPGHSFRAQWIDYNLLERLLTTIGTFYRGMLPIPDFSPRWWNSNILDSKNSHVALVMVALLGTALSTGAIVLLLRRPLALLLFVLGSAGLLIFTFSSFMGYNRHHGQFFMLLVAAFWLAETASPPGKHGWDWAERLRPKAFNGLLALNLAISAVVVTAAMFMPFSASKEVAQYLRSNYNDTLLAAMTDYAAAPIGQWLDRPLFYLQTASYSRFNTQDDDVRCPPIVDNVDKIMFLLHDAVRAQHVSQAVLMLNCGIEMAASKDAESRFIDPATGQPFYVRLHFLHKFSNSVVDDEVETLYLLQFRE